MSKLNRRRSSSEVLRFWVWEVWLENRANIKLMIGDALSFVILMSIMSAGTYYISWMPLQDESRSVLETIHFWTTSAAWMWLCLVVLVELIVASLTRIRRRLSEYKLAFEETRGKDDSAAAVDLGLEESDPQCADQVVTEQEEPEL